MAPNCTPGTLLSGIVFGGRVGLPTHWGRLQHHRHMANNDGTMQSSRMMDQWGTYNTVCPPVFKKPMSKCCSKVVGSSVVALEFAAELFLPLTLNRPWTEHSH